MVVEHFSIEPTDPDMNAFRSPAQLASSRPGRELACIWTCVLGLLIVSTSASVTAQPPVAPNSEQTEGAAGLEPRRPPPADSAVRPSDASSVAPVSEPREHVEADDPETPTSGILAQPRRLLVLDTDYVDMPTFAAMLRVQAPDWEVVPQDTQASFLRIDRMLLDLAPHEALLWFEPGNPMVRIAVVGEDGISHVSLLPSSELTTPPVATDSAATDSAAADSAAADSAAQANATRSIALVVAALLSEMEQERREWQGNDDGVESNEVESGGTNRIELRRAERSRDSLAARVQLLEEQLDVTRRAAFRPSRWPSPINPDGWFFRLGWVQGFSPVHELSFSSPYSYAFPTGGFRLAAGRHFRGYLSVGVSAVTLHARDLWNGSISGYASVHTRHRFRVGIGLEVGVLVATESNQYAGTSFGWVSPRFYLPLELAGIFTRKGGLSVKCGPVILLTPLSGFVGYDLSVEWEFD